MNLVRTKVKLFTLQHGRQIFYFLIQKKNSSTSDGYCYDILQILS